MNWIAHLAFGWLPSFLLLWPFRIPTLWWISQVQSIWIGTEIRQEQRNQREQQKPLQPREGQGVALSDRGGSTTQQHRAIWTHAAVGVLFWPLPGVTFWVSSLYDKGRSHWWPALPRFLLTFDLYECIFISNLFLTSGFGAKPYVPCLGNPGTQRIVRTVFRALCYWVRLCRASKSALVEMLADVQTALQEV